MTASTEWAEAKAGPKVARWAPGLGDTRPRTEQGEEPEPGAHCPESMAGSSRATVSGCCAAAEAETQSPQLRGPCADSSSWLPLTAYSQIQTHPGTTRPRAHTAPGTLLASLALSQIRRCSQHRPTHRP
ncbi:hypothetical protein P7K49_032502 [Saguinus oedipus]|uniref:Uncharacterized protein n=1 Tax=Saguinus oedipus TaxID=9490 RepID=A0ABQ9TYF6_SAGOE|nr:hypothetical protein P7K49_032502 [Saguinus oedipus]